MKEEIKRERKEEMKDFISAVQTVLGIDYKITLTERNKLNIGACTYISIRHCCQETLIPLDAAADLRRLDGCSIKDAAKKFVERYMECLENAPTSEWTEHILSKNNILKHVTYQVVSREKNEASLQELAHKNFLDLAVVYDCPVSTCDKTHTSFKISENLLNSLDISSDELDAAARRNTLAHGFDFNTLDAVLLELSGSKTDSHIPAMPAYVITNKASLYGASVLLFPDQFRQIAEKVESDLFIFPSSIYEVIAVPYCENAAADFAKMVYDINRIELKPQDVLCDSIYHYCLADNTIQLAKF